MGKSEYNECKTLPGESEQPQIILDAEAIYGLLIRAEVMMSKVDRVRYANRAIEQILDVIREFILAYDFEDDREMHLKRMCANVAVFLRTMRIIAERNVICIMPRYDTATPDMLKHRNDYGKLRNLVEEVSPKWLKYCHYNDDRRCFVANEGYGHNDVLVRKYGFRFNKSKHRHHDKTGNRRQQEQARLAHFGS